MEILTQWPAWTWLALFAAIIFAAVAHGAVGFGFPLLSTPLVALVSDVRTAVLATLIPNIVLNVMSIVRGANWRQTLRDHWPVAAWVLVGTVVGSAVLDYAKPAVLKLLLSALITFYLLQSRRAGPPSPMLLRHRRPAAAFFGLVGGFFSGTVNVAVPPLLIYFSALELPPLVMTQAMNLSFLSGRSTQVLAQFGTGHMGPGWFLLGIPLTMVAVLSLRGGFALQRRFSPATFARLMRILLWAMAALLAAQAARDYLR